MLHGEITTLDLVIVGLYLIAMVSIGVYFVRRIQNTEDYYVADHSFGPLVMAWTVIPGWQLENVIKKHYNLLKTLFVALIAMSILCGLSEFYIHVAWNTPYLGITPGYIIPILCSANMISNFVLSFVDKQFTDHSLIYMFMNVLVGIVPWIALFFIAGTPPMTWSICMVINTLAVVALFIFRGRIVINEFRKRFHL